jgi:hypothetical protein
MKDAKTEIVATFPIPSIYRNEDMDMIGGKAKTGARKLALLKIHNPS